jgi:uncharacterized protein (DUF1330 family)
VPAYVIVTVDVTDPDQYEQYRPLAAASIEAAGGRYCARGGAVEVLEGDRAPGRVVIIEFPDVGSARGWYDGAAYRDARAVRAGAAVGSFLLVEGVVP